MFLHELSDEISEEIIADTPHGQARGWRPAVPHFGIKGVFRRKFICGCGRVFKSEEDYRAHYIYKAVWDNESGYIPQEITKAIKEAQKNV